MNDAVTAISPARNPKAVGNSTQVGSSEKPATFAYGLMGSTFLPKTIQEEEGTLKTPPTPKISPYISVWGRAFLLSNRREVVDAIPTTLFGYDHTANRVFKGYNGATTTLPSKYYNIEIKNYATSTATTTKSIFTPSGELLATVKGTGGTATTTYVHTDHLGGTSAVTDENSDTLELADYLPYGAYNVNETYGVEEETRKFASIERDTDELDYAKARYYQNERGQFLSQDPVFWGSQKLRDPQSFNSYLYSRGNPIALLDTSGLDYAYFDARPAFRIPGIATAHHVYEAYSIDSQATANQLNIGISIPNNVSVESPLNFTIGFMPGDGILFGYGSNLTMEVGFAGSPSGDYMHANGNSFNSTAYKLNPGSYGNYAQLANASYSAGQSITNGNYNYSPHSLIALRNYFNSNSSIGTVANNTGQGANFSQFTNTVWAPGSNAPVSYQAPASIYQTTSASLLVGNRDGAFVGTYNFGSAGTYDFGTQSWK